MGTYLNPGNSGFTGIRNDTYVDKSGLIGLINDTIETPRRLTDLCQQAAPVWKVICGENVVCVLR